MKNHKILQILQKMGSWLHRVPSFRIRRKRQRTLISILTLIFMAGVLPKVSRAIPAPSLQPARTVSYVLTTLKLQAPILDVRVHEGRTYLIWQSPLNTQKSQIHNN